MSSPSARLALVTRLDAAALRRIRAAAAFDRIVCVEAAAGVAEAARAAGLPVQRVDFKDWPQGYLVHVRAVYEQVEAAFAKDPGLAAWLTAAAAALGVSERHLANAAKKGFAVDLAADSKLALLGAMLFPDAERTLFAEHPALARLASLEKRTRAVHGEARLHARFAALAAWLAARIAAPCPRAGEVIRGGILFDQKYGALDNPEFPAFYRSLRRRDDVVYNCVSSGDAVHRTLAADGKPAWDGAWGVAGAGAKARALARLARSTVAGRSAPVELRLWALRFLRETLRLRFLLEGSRPKIYLKVRADFDPEHPIATAVCEELGVLHAGYSCGSYPFLIYPACWLDFHVYGVFGEVFRGIYADAWRGVGRFFLLGPFTGETHDPALGHEARAQTTIAVFPTTTHDGIFMQEPFYRDFIEQSCSAARRLKARVVFKSKEGLSDTAAAAFLHDSARDLDHSIVTHQDRGTRPAEVLADCDIALVMSTSTVAWEALARGRKLAIYDQAWMPHPFAELEPNLVARTGPELERLVAWLAATPQDEYERAIAPLIARLAKRSDGNLVDDFIKSLENAS